MCPQPPIARRSFLRLLLDGSVIGLLGATVFPIAKYLYPPKGSDSSVSSVVAAKAGELAKNAAKIFRFELVEGRQLSTCGERCLGLGASALQLLFEFGHAGPFLPPRHEDTKNNSSRLCALVSWWLGEAFRHLARWV